MRIQGSSREFKMDTKEIIRRIDEVIDSDLARIEKIKLLKELAFLYWDAVFPERRTPAFDNLSVEEQTSRWEAVRKRNEISGTRNPNGIRYVVDWPGTGGSFSWVK
jgi:hypothetical protein